MKKMIENKSSAGRILLAWAVVGLPLGWGVYNTAVNAMLLFKTPPAAATPAIPGPTAAPAAK
jgi:hypothetical protein